MNNPQQPGPEQCPHEKAVIEYFDLRLSITEGIKITADFGQLVGLVAFAFQKAHAQPQPPSTTIHDAIMEQWSEDL